MNKSDNINRTQPELRGGAQSQATVPFPGSLSPAQAEQQATCEHDWQRDGQTMTAVRWTCSKCFKTELS